MKFDQRTLDIMQMETTLAAEEIVVEFLGEWFGDRDLPPELQDLMPKDQNAPGGEYAQA